MSKLQRSLQQIIRGQETSDGDGVRLTRVIGGAHLPQLDPFLLMDDFRSDDPEDYIGGFPPHPHRGFETVTYQLHGRMRHHDSAGHGGVIEAGGVQWMTAGRGIVHSEMPEQENGLLAGIQLWINLPAANKMMAPRYQEFDAGRIPLEVHDNGVRIKVLAGTTTRGTVGPVQELVTPTSYFDIQVPAGTRHTEQVEAGRNAFIYLLEGEIRIDGRTLPALHLGLLGPGGEVMLEASRDSRLLLISGQPLNEPVVRGGPFVMNTSEELMQAYRDYRDGRLATAH